MKYLYALVLMLCVQAVAVADLKVTTKNTAGGQSTQSTIYIKGQRQRTEAANQISIYQCDLKRMIQANDGSRTYTISPLDEADETPAAAKVTTPPRPAARTRRGGIVTYTISTTDTGERKQMFGYTARRIKTVTVIDAPEGTCEPGRTEFETDGWYIDLQFAFNCSEDRPAAPPSQPTTEDCRDEIRYRRTGAGRPGFPVLLTTKMKLAGMEAPEDAEAAAMMERMAGPMMTTTMEVTDITKATLDAALFDVPAGYTKVSSSQGVGRQEGLAGRYSVGVRRL